MKKQANNAKKEPSKGKGKLAGMNTDKDPKDIDKKTGSERDKGTLGKMNDD